MSMSLLSTKRMRKYWFLVLILMTAAAEGFGANWYVHKGANGSNNGTSWTNAWNEMSSINFSSVSCGDTIWIAGGSAYTSTLTINKTCTSGSPLIINRVLSTDTVPVTSPGWNSAFDSQVVISNGGINLAAGAYYTINGRIGSVSSNNFGISVQCTVSNGCNAVSGAGSGNLSNVTLTYVELYGPSCVMSQSCGGGGASGLNVAPSTNQVNYLVFDHGWIHQFGELVRTSNWNNSTIQYSNLSVTHNDGQQHEDVIYNYAQTNFTMRYNNIWSSPNDGIFFDFGGTNGFYFYGNIYHHSGGQLITFKSGYSNALNVYYYNNVFQNDGTYGDYTPGWLDFSGATSTSGEIANNVYENMYNVGTPPNANHNAYSIAADKDSGTGTISYTPGGQFANEPNDSNPPAADFHLSAAGATTFQNGKTLSSPYNMDPDGNTRGANGHWYIGAYQYVTGSLPAPPTNLTATPH
jgi:hypothetical protein